MLRPLSFTLSVLLAASLTMAVIVEPVIASDAGKTRVSCTEGGDVVYKQDLPSSEVTDRRKKAISLAHPSAMCVYLELNRGPNSFVVADSNHDVDGETYLPEDALDVNEDLAAALAIIAEGKVGARYPDGIESFVRSGTRAPKKETAAKPVPSKAAKSAESGFLSMAIGIYRDVPASTILAHWRTMQKESKLLAKLTPTINTVDNVSMLSVMHISDNVVAPLCAELEKLQSKCITAY